MQTIDGYTLITSLGNRPMEETNYQFEEKQIQGRFPAAVLPRLLEMQLGKPSRAVVLLTPEAERENWNGFREEFLRNGGLEPETRPIPAPQSEEDLSALLETLIGVCRPDEKIVLDVTNSFRSLPFVFFTSLTYLSALSDVQVRGVYYAAREPGQVRTPVVDLTWLVHLTDWFYGVRAFKDSGSLRSIQELLRQRRKNLFRIGSVEQRLTDVLDAVAALEPALAAPAPLEAGIAARQLIARLDAASERALAPLVGGAHVLSSLKEAVIGFADTSGEDSKHNLPLGAPELERELALIEWYADRGQLASALLLFREWIISRVLACDSDRRDWYIGGAEGTKRHHVERKLGALHQRTQLEEKLKTLALSQAQRELAGIWDSVSNDRNTLAHSGFRKDDVTRDLLKKMDGRLRKYLATAKERIDSRFNRAWSLEWGDAQGRLLVAPLGMSPGSVYSAVRRVAPSHLLVLTSASARERLNEALTAADWSGPEPIVVELQDAHAGFGEVKGLAGSDVVREALLGAEEVVVSLTGGTTALQFAVERVREEALRLGVPERRIAVVDRRPVEEQRREPFVLGELVELDAEGSSTPAASTNARHANALYEEDKGVGQ